MSLSFLKCPFSLLPSPVWPLPIYLDSWIIHDTYLFSVLFDLLLFVYSINICYTSQTGNSRSKWKIWLLVISASQSYYKTSLLFNSIQFSAVIQSCPTLCNTMDCCTPGFPVHHQLLELAQTHVHQVGDAIQPSQPLSFPSPPAFNLSHHQSLFQWVGSLHQVAKVLEFQLQRQSFQWIFRTDLL